MTILSTQERKYEMKTFNGNFAKKVRICRLPVPGNAKLKLPIHRNAKRRGEYPCTIHRHRGE